MSYRVELAASGRAICKGTKCKKETIKIEKNSLRQGVLVQLPNGHESWAWRHWGCVTPTVLHNWMEAAGGDMEMVDGYDDLPPDAQEKVKRALEEEHVDDDDWMGDAEMNRYNPEKPMQGMFRKTPRAKKVKDEDDEDVADSPAPKKKAASRKRKADAEDDDEAEKKPAPKKSRSRKVTEPVDGECDAAPPPAKKSRAKKVTEPVDDEDDAAPPPAKKSRAKKVKDEVPEDDDVAPPPPAKKSRAKKIKSEVDEDEDEKPAPVAKKGRNAKRVPVKVHDSDVEDAQADDAGEVEEEPPAAAKKGGRKKAAPKKADADQPAKRQKRKTVEDADED